MHHRFHTIVTLLVVSVLVPVLATAQVAPQTDNATDWEMPRLANGQPDLQGYWTTQTFTPMERPEYLGDQAFYTEEQWAQLQAQLTVDGADPLARNVITIGDPEETCTHLGPDASETKPMSITTMPFGWQPPSPRAYQVAGPRWSRTPRTARFQSETPTLKRGPTHGAPCVVTAVPLMAMSCVHWGERCIHYGYNGPPLQPPGL